MKKGKISALLPIIIFLVLFAGMGILSGDFYAMPAVVGFMIALVVAFCQNRTYHFGEKLSIVAKGAGEENIITMCFIFLLAGAFSGAVKAAGGVESTVNFGLTILPSSVAVVGIFVIACFVSISMGTSVGTIGALTPIAIGISEKTGFPMAVCVSSVVCGAMFGDNLSMISDTTIAAVRTQGCEMKDKFKQNFFIVLPAATLTMVLFYLNTRAGSYEVAGELPYNLLQILPYLVVLVGALVGVNVFVVLISGTVVSLIVGVALGSILPMDVFKVVGNGVNSMYDITCISLIVAGIIALVKANGGIDYILAFIRSRVKSKKGAAFGIALLASLVDICTANNTVAIVIAGPIAKEIAEEFDIEPKSTASILDIFTSAWQGLIPYGAQLLTAAALVQEFVGKDAVFTPFHMLPYLYYPILMAISALLFFGFRNYKKKENIS